MPPGTVIRSFAAPATTPAGLAWDGRALWISDQGTDLIYQIDPVTGTVIRSFAAPAASSRGLAWDGQTLWNCDNGTDLIYQIDPLTGTVIRSFASPAGTPVGLTWDGRTLWNSDPGAALIYQIDPITGSTIRSFATPGIGTSGLAWDGHMLWNSDSGADRIHQIDPVTGTTIRSFPAARTAPRGLVWDGRTLWHTDVGADLIYQLSVTPGASYADRVIATGPIAYWPQWEAAGTISFDISGHSPLSERDGAYTGVTLGQPGIGDGRTAPLFDGANDYNDIFTASFSAAFNGAEGSMMVWARVANAGVWADGLVRYCVRFLIDANNIIYITKIAAANTIQFFYSAGGVIEAANVVVGPTAEWFNVGMTWSKAAEEVIYYVNGAPADNDINLGVWAGVPQAANTIIGAATLIPTQAWDGYLAHIPWWDRPLSPAEMLSLGVL